MFNIQITNTITKRVWLWGYEYSGAVQFFQTREAAQLRVDSKSPYNTNHKYEIIEVVS